MNDLHLASECSTPIVIQIQLVSYRQCGHAMPCRDCGSHESEHLKAQDSGASSFASGESQGHLLTILWLCLKFKPFKLPPQKRKRCNKKKSLCPQFQGDYLFQFGSFMGIQALRMALSFWLPVALVGYTWHCHLGLDGFVGLLQEYGLSLLAEVGWQGLRRRVVSCSVGASRV